MSKPSRARQTMAGSLASSLFDLVAEADRGAALDAIEARLRSDVAPALASQYARDARVIALARELGEDVALVAEALATRTAAGRLRDEVARGTVRRGRGDDVDDDDELGDTAIDPFGGSIDPYEGHE